MRQAVRVGIVLPAVLLLVSGCATKKWVTELVGKKEVEIDQRVAGVDKKLTDETQRVDQRVEGVDTRLKTTEGGLTQTTEVARGARERADGAYTKADETSSRLTRLWSNRYNQRRWTRSRSTSASTRPTSPTAPRPPSSAWSGSWRPTRHSW